MKKIGLVLALAGMLLAGSMAWSNLTHAGQPPDCAPEDRVVAGNTNTDCKWDYRMDDLTGVRFVVLEREGADACYGALEFYPYDVGDLAPVNGLRLRFADMSGDGRSVEWSRYSDGSSVRWDLEGQRYVVAQPYEGGNSSLRMLGYLYSLNDRIPEEWSPRSSSGLYGQLWNYRNVLLRNNDWGGDRSVNYTSRWLPIPPEINDFPVTLNACLAGVKLRLETEAQVEEDRAKLAAQELAKQHALNEEKAKAALDAQRLASAQKALQIQRETELTKTRSLIARLERDKIILSIWNDIVLARLRGFQERAEITNRYLAEIEANAAAFSAKVREKYEELQRLEALNQAIADSIAAHNAEIEAQLAAAAELEAKNMAKLEDLSVTPPTPAPAPGG